MSGHAIRRRLAQESGQVIAIMLAAMVVFVAVAGLVADIGIAYQAQRALQTSVDAAALAGAQELPNAANAQATAHRFGATVGQQNQVKDVVVTETIKTSCITIIPGCSPVNALSVDEVASVPTFFARIVGVNSIRIHAHAAACSPCGFKPVDIMLVLDRTGSMCQGSAGRADPACTDLNNARAGIRTFLSYFDSSTAWVGLAVLPPAASVATRCATPATTNYNSPSSPYVVVPMSRDYRLADGSLNASSDLVSTLACIKGAGSTSYANAIEAAQAELIAHGRASVPDVIVFMSDGAANIGPTYYATTSPYRRQPCRQGITSAATVRATGTTIYTIGYALDDATGGCTSYTGSPESPTITVYDALRGIASAPDKFLVKPTSGQLQTIYTAIAQDIALGASSLFQ